MTYSRECYCINVGPLVFEWTPCLLFPHDTCLCSLSPLQAPDPPVTFSVNRTWVFSHAFLLGGLISFEWLRPHAPALRQLPQAAESALIVNFVCGSGQASLGVLVEWPLAGVLGLGVNTQTSDSCSPRLWGVVGKDLGGRWASCWQLWGGRWTQSREPRVQTLVIAHAHYCPVKLVTGDQMLSILKTLIMKLKLAELSV